MPSNPTTLSNAMLPPPLSAEQEYNSNKAWIFTVPPAPDSDARPSIVFRQKEYDGIAVECRQKVRDELQEFDFENFLIDTMAMDLQLSRAERPLEGLVYYTGSKDDDDDMRKNKARWYQSELAETLSRTATKLRSWQQDAAWLVGLPASVYQAPSTARGAVSTNGQPEKIVMAIGLQHLLDVVGSVCGGLSECGTIAVAGTDAGPTAGTLQKWDDVALQSILSSSQAIVSSVHSIAQTFLHADESAMQVSVDMPKLYGNEIIVDGSLKAHMASLCRDAAPLEVLPTPQDSSLDSKDPDSKRSKRPAFTYRIRGQNTNSTTPDVSVKESASRSFCAAFNKVVSQRPDLFKVPPYQVD